MRIVLLKGPPSGVGWRTTALCKSISFVGTLNWIEALEGDPDYNYKGGIKLITIDSKDKWALLDYAYEAWKDKKEAGVIKETSSK